jgi:hypothetical protein
MWSRVVVIDNKENVENGQAINYTKIGVRNFPDFHKAGNFSKILNFPAYLTKPCCIKNA